jgi:hypothetical protein
VCAYVCAVGVRGRTREVRTRTPQHLKCVSIEDVLSLSNTTICLLEEAAVIQFRQIFAHQSPAEGPYYDLLEKTNQIFYLF